MTETTETQKERVTRPDEHTAAICRAIAYRALSRYRQCCDDVQFYGGNIEELFGPPAPPLHELAKSYRSELDEWGPEPPASPATIGATVELLSQMAADALIADATQETIFTPEDDACDALRLLAGIRSWVERINIKEAIEEERERFSARDATIRRAAEILVAEARKGDDVEMSVRKILDGVEREIAGRTEP